MLAEVRVLLVGEETLDLKELATRADQLWLKFAQRNQVAAVQPKDEPQAADTGDETTVAAMQGKKKFYKKKKRSSPAAGQQASGGGTQQKQGGKGKNVFLCHTHLKYGTSAYFCAEPDSCAWPEN
jgi:hypothetical protein